MKHLTISQFPLGPTNPLVISRWINWFARFINTAKIWKCRYESRHKFSNVRGRILKDIGISDAFRFVEVNKPFWEQ